MDEKEKKQNTEKPHECGGGCGGGCHSSEEIDYSSENILQGPYSTYDPADDIYTEGECDGGRQHGPYKEYYGMEKKSLKVEGGYKEGLLHGAWTYYDKEGKITKVQVFQEGKLIEERGEPV